MDTNLASFVQTLKDKGVLCEIVPEHVFKDGEAAVLVVDYAPSHDKPTVSFGFTMANSENLGAKCWINRPPGDIKSINENGPRHHPNYKEFSYRDFYYYPYSAQLGSFEWDKISDACHALYAHTEI